MDGIVRVVTLIEAYYAKDLVHNMLSCCKLEEKGVALIYEDGKRCLARVSDGARVFEVTKKTMC